jgi:membrane protease YdiL (CAAX protease family)
MVSPRSRARACGLVFQELNAGEVEKSNSRTETLSAATAVGLAVALLLPIPPYREPFLHMLMRAWGMSWISAWESIGLVSKLTVIFVLPLVVIYWERRPLSSIGLRSPTLRDFLAALATIIAYVGLSPLVISIAFEIPAIAKQLTYTDAMYASLPKLLDWSGLLANGIAEEVGFRGYAIERIEELTGSTFWGASIPFVIEMLAHAGAWGLYGMLAKAPILMLLVALYLWRRNLPACVLVHIFIDILAFEL